MEKDVINGIKRYCEDCRADGVHPLTSCETCSINAVREAFLQEDVKPETTIKCKDCKHYTLGWVRGEKKYCCGNWIEGDEECATPPEDGFCYLAEPKPVEKTEYRVISRTTGQTVEVKQLYSDAKKALGLWVIDHPSYTERDFYIARVVTTEIIEGV